MTGRILGLDPGERRTGVAVSDPTGTIASPHGFVVADEDQIQSVVGLMREFGATRVVIGLPFALDGSEGPSARRSRSLGSALVDAGVEVEYWDERFTTKTAEAALIESGMRRKNRKSRRDQVAAAIMLQGFLDAQRHRNDDDGDDA